tara:strand:+ start:181 stop:627 length:447 start_codon:yes stop_codon:yes gene_type:complete
MRSYQGFTIIETILVLSLLSILTIMAIPRFQTGIDEDVQLQKELTRHIKKLKWLSMYDPQRAYTLVIEQTQKHIYLIKQDQGALHTQVLTKYAPQQIIELNRTTPDLIKIQFNRYGRLIGQLKNCSDDCLSINQHPICLNQEGFIFDC